MKVRYLVLHGIVRIDEGIVVDFATFLLDHRPAVAVLLVNLRKVTEDKLEIGSLVRTVISIEEGLVFKDGRKQKPKKLVPFWNILPLMGTSPEVILSKVV